MSRSTLQAARTPPRVTRARSGSVGSVAAVTDCAGFKVGLLRRIATNFGRSVFKGQFKIVNWLVVDFSVTA